MDDDATRIARRTRSRAMARCDDRMAEDGIDTAGLHDYQIARIRTRWPLKNAEARRAHARVRRKQDRMRCAAACGLMRAAYGVVRIS
jgi:hypothetical protein